MVGRGAGKRGGEAKNAGKASAGEGVFFFFKTVTKNFWKYEKKST